MSTERVNREHARIKKMVNDYDNLRNNNLWMYYNCYEPGERPVDVYLEGKKHTLFSTNNYLGLAKHPDVIKSAVKAAKEYGIGTGASLAVTGGTLYHKKLEKALSEFYGYESAIVLSSGYMANSAVVSALVGEDTCVFCDKFLHVSFLNSLKLHNVEPVRYKHNDAEDLEKRIISKKEECPNNRYIIITESVFSQHGEIAKVDKLAKIAKEHKAVLVVDDAHGLGTIGEKGHGILDYYKLTSNDVDIITGAMNKALGSQGGYILGSKKVIELIEVKAHELIFTSSLPAMSMAASLASLEKIAKDESFYKKLKNNIDYFREKLEAININVPESVTPIMPIIIGDEEKTCRLSRNLQENGIIVVPIIAPGVPKGMGRLRIQLSSEHSKEDIDGLVSFLKCL